MLEEFKGDILQWLRGFYYIAQTGSFSKAGEVMNRNQSSITYQLKKLEEELGVTLISRKSSPVQLTPEGQRLYPIVTKIFDNLQQIRMEVAQGAEPQGRITITATYGIASHYLPGMISRFTELYPKVEFDILPERAAFVAQSYMAESSDFVIAQQDRIPEGAVFIPLKRCDLYLVTPKGWPEPKGEVTLEYLASHPFIGLVRELPLDKRLLDDLKKKKLSISVVQYASFFLTALHYVSLGKGACVLDEEQVHFSGTQFNTYSLAHLMPKRVYGIAYRPHQYLAPHVRKFIQFLKEQSEPELAQQ